jgi:transcriptional regulator with XRE-family HTH domain
MSAGWAEPTLSGVERSERNVSIDNIAGIAEGLRVEPWKLLRDE